MKIANRLLARRITKGRIEAKDIIQVVGGSVPWFSKLRRKQKLITKLSE